MSVIVLPGNHKTRVRAADFARTKTGHKSSYAVRAKKNETPVVSASVAAVSQPSTAPVAKQASKADSQILISF